MKLKNVAMLLSGLGALYVSLALHGGSDSVAAARAETSGTRLKAKVTTGSDGSKLYDAEVLYDSTLDVDCKFEKASDGMQRCLPTAPPTWVTDNSVVFTDDKCMNGIVGLFPAPQGCAQSVPKYVQGGVPATQCEIAVGDYKLAIYQVGALNQSAPGPRWTRNGADMCVSANPPQDRVWYNITAEVAPSSFVPGTAGTQ